MRWLAWRDKKTIKDRTQDRPLTFSIEKTKQMYGFEWTKNMSIKDLRTAVYRRTNMQRLRGKPSEFKLGGGGEGSIFGYSRGMGYLTNFLHSVGGRATALANLVFLLTLEISKSRITQS